VSAEATAGPPAGRGSGRLLAVAGLPERFFREIGRFVLTLGRVLAWTVRPPYDLRQLFTQMVRVGVDSVPVVFLTALFTGAVLALQTHTTLARFGAERWVGSLVALSMLRELSAVLSGLIVAGRAGSAMAAELGTMRVTEQIDALEVMATDPIHYLMVPRVWAATITLPLLVVVGDLVGIVGGYLVAVVLLGSNPVAYMDSTFQYMELHDLFSGVTKAAFFGLLIGVIGCQKGYFTEGGAEGVGRSTTQAVVLASIAILISDFFLTKLLF
jgi:phospholipid/cholesterol/gamma-HCH transport system permease protein